MCCCKKTLVYCSPLGTCAGSLLDLGIVAQYAGVHKLVLTFKGVQFTIEETFAVGDQIKFPTESLNENYTYTAEIFQPDGQKMLIAKDEVNYDCIEFKTIISYAA